MNHLDQDYVFSPEETDCAGCGRPVDENQTHMKFVAACGHRRQRAGRFHLSCLPLGGLDGWLTAESERLYRT